MVEFRELDAINTQERGTLSFEVRVRGKKYLWGSAGMKSDATFTKPPLLHLRNDPHGEPITLTVRKADGTETLLGSLEAGECMSVQIQNISGLHASCNAESLVRCALR